MPEAPAAAGSAANASFGEAGDARRDAGDARREASEVQAPGAEVAATQARPTGERESQPANRASDGEAPPDRAE